MDKTKIDNKPLIFNSPEWFYWKYNVLPQIAAQIPKYSLHSSRKEVSMSRDKEYRIINQSGLCIIDLKVFNPKSGLSEAVSALIDTGAGTTMISPYLFEKLCLTRLQDIMMRGFEGISKSFYSSVAILVEDLYDTPELMNVGITDMHHAPWDVILGCDFLNNFIFTRTPDETKPVTFGPG